MAHLKTLIKRIILTIGIVGTLPFTQVAFAQSSNPLVPKINIPSSPEAALIGRFGQIPIGYYTGTANISIPIYNLKEGNINIPIELSYHSSGIKVDDQATWVGLGWNLSPEGTIIQEVRGKQDEFDNKLHFISSPTDYATFKNRITSASPAGVNRTVAQLGVALYDFCLDFSCDMTLVGNKPGDDASQIVGSLLENHGQPDIYHFSFAGHTGKFYINPETQQIVQLEKKEEIFFQKNNQNSFTATTLDGTTFLFDVIETAYELGNYPFSDRAGKTYKLSSIQTLTGKSVTFAYVDAHFTDFNYSQNTTLNDPIGTPVAPPTLNTRQCDIKILSSITTSDVKIDFILEGREDIIPNAGNVNNVKRLKTIDISSVLSNKKIRSFDFTYSYFPYTLTGVPSTGGVYPTVVTNYEASLGKRLKLENVKEIGYDDSEQRVLTANPYVFDYDLSNTMPLKLSFAKDFWGYYNGQPNQLLLPDLAYFDYPYVFKANTDNIPFTYTYQGANRYTDNQKAAAYMLKKISYPTGGFTEFEFEPNTFSNQFIPDNADAVFKSIDVQDHSLGGTASTLFPLSKETTLRFENRINNGAGNYNGVTPLTYAQMQDCYIKFSKIKMVGGSPVVTLIKQWDLSTVLNTDFQANGGKTWTEDLRVVYDAGPNVNYQLQVYFPDHLNNPLFATIAGVTSHVTFFDDSGVGISQSNQNGMRIKTIKSYTESLALTSNKLLTYQGGKLLSNFRPIQLQSDLWLFSCVPIPNSCPQFSLVGNYNRLLVSSDGLTRDAGNPIGYDLVTETELAIDNITSNGRKEFNFLNFENIADDGFPVLTNSRNGFIQNEYTYNRAGSKLAETNYTYQNLISNDTPFYSTTINTHFFGSDPREEATLGSRHKYSYNAFPLIADWFKLQTKTQKAFLGSQVLTSAETYTYNSEGSVSTVTATNSKSENLITKYFYPQDNLINGTVDGYMTGVHNTGTPVITEQYNGATLLTRTKTVYGAVSGAPTYMPQYIYSKKGAAAEEKRVTITSYDNKGNITEYSEENNIPVSLVWNVDKTVPLAKIENATYASLLALPGGLSANFRTALPNARVTTYTYKPLIGVITTTDINNKTMSYEYDAFGRLVLVRDWNNNVLKRICYNYAGQPEDCVVNINALWQSTGTTRCQPCPANGSYFSNIQEHQEKDNNPYSATYNTTRWVSDGVSGNCPTPADWQNTATAIRCKVVSGVNTGEREREQKDMNPCSPDYNQLRWVVVDQNCSVCPKPANWTATGNLRCVVNGSSENTGYQEKEERDLETCSSTYNQYRWVSNGYNVAACPLPSVCNSGNCSGNNKKCVGGVCETGVEVEIDCYFDPATQKYVHVYAYKFSNNTYSTYTRTERNPFGCPIEM